MGPRRGAANSATGPMALAALDRNNDVDDSMELPSDDEAMDESYMGGGGGSRKSSLSKRHFLDDSAEDEEDADESYLAPLKHNSDAENEDEENVVAKPSSRRSVGRNSIGGRKSVGGGAKKKKGRSRQRRRSSARFLRLSGRFDTVDEEGGENGSGAPALDKENLGEVYRQAIRMNAENKINAGNSWGLKLIENMDKLVHGDDDDAAMEGKAGSGTDGEKRVNFTKASCTLDASVKIYGYRVDDVHLTSYKVLHNLNRTDAGGKQKKQTADDVEGDVDIDSDVEVGRARKQKRGTTDTLESNLANINMSKLDSAPDIDPLFRKMSKAFDEGGAKGLLLNNLGVARDGCRIEFDSREDTITEQIAGPVEEEKEEETESNEEKEISDSSEDGNTIQELEQQEEEKASMDDNDDDSRDEKMIDITNLVSKLREVLNGSSVEALSFVPQLEVLRSDFATLEADGFADEGKTKGLPSRPARYGVTDEEEKEAERSIHIEAIERSHRSAANVSFAAMSNEGGEMQDGDGGDDMFGDDDFGGGADDFDDDDDGDMVFTNFLAMDINAEKYSSVEFHSNSQGDGTEQVLPATSMRTRTTTTALLDAICSSDALIAGGEFEYFNADTLDRITKGNMWAGSEHWKKTTKMQSKKKKEATSTAKKSSGRKKKSSKERAFVDLKSSTEFQSCLEGLINNKPNPKGKSNNDPLQLTKAAISKAEKNDNLLPPDAGVGIEQLSRLFMRPDAAIQPKKAVSDAEKPRKSVGFFDMGPTVFDDGDDGSFGGDDDGPGFQFADDDDDNGGRDDFVIEDLEGVRKVEKINIGYATVAKKVDVKRLKKDLWSNLEIKTAVKPEKEGEAKEEGEQSSTSGDDSETIEADAEEDKEKTEEDSNKSSEMPRLPEGAVSFQDTVKELAVSQNQSEVTLPFYFICVLHLANEKGLFLDQSNGLGLSDFVISKDDGSAPTFGNFGTESVDKPVKSQRRKRGGGMKKQAQYVESEDEDASAMSEEEYE